MQELNTSNEIGLLALFIHPYIFILCSAYSRSRDFCRLCLARLDAEQNLCKKMQTGFKN